MKFFPVILLNFLFLPNTALGFVSVCDRTPQVRDAIAAQFGIPCEKVSKKDLERVKKLELANKGIKNLKLGDFDGLDKLSFLALNNNQLKEIPEGLFLPMLNLKELHLNDNSLKGLTGKSLDGLQNSLQKLWVERNGLTTLILQKFRYLEDLRANSNKLGLGSGLDFLLTELPELDNLSLSGNELNSVDIDGLGKLPKLTSLDFSFNHLQMIIDFRERFPHLEYLELNNNQIRHVPKGLFFSGVKVLDLSGNRIFSLPGEIPPGANMRLQYMNIFRNPIVKLPRWVKEKDKAMKLTVDYGPLYIRCGLAMRQLFGH